jgi:arylsulfatase A-like enzyme
MRMTRRRACASALAALSAGGCSGSAPASRPANLLLVTVDTLRADHLGFAGYARDTSPRLDALSREGVAFPRCYSVSATTGAAHASLFTSVMPHEHGVLANRQRFPRGQPTLMSALRARGYHAAGFVSSVVVGRKSGLQDEFDHFDDQGTTAELNRRGRPERPAADTLAAAAAHLDTLDPGTPFLLWVHLIDPHGPYAAPEEPDRFVGDGRVPQAPMVLPVGATDWAERQIPAYQALPGRTDADYYVARYDGEVRYADAALGRFLDRLRARGRYDHTLIAVTADHGETLAEPGRRRVFSHGTVAYEEVVRVPLVIREPAGRRRLGAADPSRPLSTLDLAPTLLDLLGVPAPASFRGRRIAGAAAPEDRAFVSFGAYGSEHLEKVIGTQFTVRRGPWRYVVNSRDGAEELFDHRVDPGETKNVAADHPAERDALRAVLAAARAARPRAAEPVETTPEHERALRALGYVQ